MNDQAIEQQIQAKGKTAPRVTPADIEANIASAHYFTAKDGVLGDLFIGGVIDGPDGHGLPQSLDLLTFCVLTLKNGFTVTGESACASPENFDAQIGRDIARQNAVQKIWPLMGYQLRDELHRRAQLAAEPTTSAGSQLDQHLNRVRESGWTPGDGAGQQTASTMQPHQQRVVDEHAELDERVTKLLDFIRTPIFDGLDSAERDRLLRQADVMSKYLNILRDRIAAF